MIPHKRQIRHTLFAWLWLAALLSLTACLGGFSAEPTVTVAPPTETPAPTLTPTPDPYSGVGFDLFLAELNDSLLRDRPALVTRYMAQLPAGPLTDGNRAIFLWQGPAQSVRVAGDMSNWQLETALPLQHIDGTDLWAGEGQYESDARLDYKFVIDGNDWRLDPLNPRTILGGFGPNSELAMPEYEMPPELQPGDDTYPAGTITEHTLDSINLDQRRTFFVYTPAGQLVGAKWPTVLIHDGGEYINLIDAPAILDRLIAEGDIPPVLAVFIPPINRSQEYDHNDAYVNFLADELIPFIQETYDTDPDPAQTGNIGASLGGLLAVYAAATRPDTFGLAGGYSGAYALGNDAVIRQLAALSDPLPRLYLVVGTYETAVSGNDTIGNILAANQRLAQVLGDRQYDYTYIEAHEGHSWGLWRGYLGDGLRFLYGR